MPDGRTDVVAVAAALACRMPALAGLQEFQLTGYFGASIVALVAVLPPSLPVLLLHDRRLGAAGGVALVASAPALAALRSIRMNWYGISLEQAAALRAGVPSWCEVRHW